MTDEERRLALEHRDMLLDLRAVLANTSGRNFVRYLMKHLEVNALPELGLEGPLLHDRLGSLRFGRRFYSLVSQANGLIATQLLSEIEKERYDQDLAEQNTPST